MTVSRLGGKMENIDALVQSRAGLLVDIIIAILFLLFIAVKGKRGLYSCGMSVFVIALAVTLGIFVSSLVSPVVFKHVYPDIAQQISDRYDAEIAAQESDTETPAQVFNRGFDNLIKSLGLEDKVSGYVQEITSRPKQELLDKRAASTFKLIRFVSFGLFTALGILILTIIKNYFGKIADWPVIKWVDTAGGMIIGFLECYAILFLAIKGADLFGITFFNDMSEGTVLLDFINSHKDANELYQMGMDLVNNGLDKVKGTINK